MISGLSERIKQRRISANLTQKSLSDKTGISISAISSYETGRRDAPADALIELSSALNCSIDYLLVGRGDEEPERRLIDISDLTDDEAQDIIYILRRMSERRRTAST